MRVRLLTATAVCLALAVSFSGQALAAAEEVRVLITNNLTYDLIFRPNLSAGCPEEGEAFLITPPNVPMFERRVAAWRGECAVKLTYELRFFTNVFLTIFYNPETGLLWARSNSPIIRPQFTRIPCLEGTCLFNVTIREFSDR